MSTTAAMVNPAGPVKSAVGRFGVYGGRYVPETLMAALEELEAAYARGAGGCGVSGGAG